MHVLVITSLIDNSIKSVVHFNEPNQQAMAVTVIIPEYGLKKKKE